MKQPPSLLATQQLNAAKKGIVSNDDTQISIARDWFGKNITSLIPRFAEEIFDLVAEKLGDPRFSELCKANGAIAKRIETLMLIQENFPRACNQPKNANSLAKLMGFLAGKKDPKGNSQNTVENATTCLTKVEELLRKMNN